jgi:hypothetical protein
MSPNAGDGGSSGVSAHEYSCAHGAQIKFGDLTPYLTYDSDILSIHVGDTRCDEAMNRQLYSYDAIGSRLNKLLLQENILFSSLFRS